MRLAFPIVYQNYFLRFAGKLWSTKSKCLVLCCDYLVPSACTERYKREVLASRLWVIYFKMVYCRRASAKKGAMISNQFAVGDLFKKSVLHACQCKIAYHTVKKVCVKSTLQRMP